MRRCFQPFTCQRIVWFNTEACHSSFPNKRNKSGCYNCRRIQSINRAGQLILFINEMAEAYHNEALRKQRIVDKMHAALARIEYGQVRLV